MHHMISQRKVNMRCYVKARWLAIAADSILAADSINPQDAPAA